MKKHLRFLTVLVLASVGSPSPYLAIGQDNSSEQSKLMLREDQSSAKVQARGDVLSSTQFTPKAWYPTSVPTTVLNALVENNVYPDPYSGMNLRSIPGTQYPIGDNFSNRPMPPDSPFRVPRWYRQEFQLPLNYKGKTIWLHFYGINF